MPVLGVQDKRRNMSFKHFKQSIIMEREISFQKVDDRYYYIYRITNLENNIHYYGSRVSIIHPMNDLGNKYFSSSKILKPLAEENPDNFKFKILKIFDNKWDKILYESYLHQYFNVKNNDKFYNKVNQTQSGFDTTGVKNLHSSKTKQKISKAIKGKINYKNIITGETGRISKEEFDRRDDLTFVNIGMVTCKDEFGNKYKVTKEEFNKRSDLYGLTKGVPKSKEHNRKNSEARKGTTLSNSTKEKIRNIVLNQPKIQCPHCTKILDKRNAKRWHFDNCKLKKR